MTMIGGWEEITIFFGDKFLLATFTLTWTDGTIGVA